MAGPLFKDIFSFMTYEDLVISGKYEHQLDWKEKDIDTSDWKVYKDESNFFSIKYPSDWKQQLSYLIPPPPEGCSFDCSPGIFFEVHENKGHLTSRAYLFKTLGKPEEDQNGRPEYYLVTNRPAHWEKYDVTIYDGTLGTGNPGPAIFIAYGDKLLQINSDSIDLDLYSKILSTLRFF